MFVTAILICLGARELYCHQLQHRSSCKTITRYAVAYNRLVTGSRVWWLGTCERSVSREALIAVRTQRQNCAAVHLLWHSSSYIIISVERWIKNWRFSARNRAVTITSWWQDKRWCLVLRSGKAFLHEVKIKFYYKDGRKQSVLFQYKLSFLEMMDKQISFAYSSARNYSTAIIFLFDCSRHAALSRHWIFSERSRNVMLTRRSVIHASVVFLRSSDGWGLSQHGE